MNEIVIALKDNKTTEDNVTPPHAPAARTPTGNGAPGGGSGGSTKLPIRDEETSKHLTGAAELVVVADIKPGLIDVRETITYATRLRMLLRTLNAIRKKRAEKAEESVFFGPIELLQTIHFVRWTIFDDEQKMLLAVVFDRPLEAYIQRLVSHASPVLNAILCHCEGYEGYKGYTAFTDFVRKNQVPVEFFGASVPGLTVDDQQYLKTLEQRQRAEPDAEAFDLAAAKLSMKSPLKTAREASDGAVLEAARQALVKNSGQTLEQAIDDASNARREKTNKQALRVMEAFYRLEEFFPEPAPLENEKKLTDVNRKNALAARKKKIRERAFFHTMVAKALPGFRSNDVPDDDNDPLRQRYERELGWFTCIEIVENNQIEKAAETKLPAQRSAQALQQKIQGNIFTGYKGITHGCLLLINLGDTKAAHRFVKSLNRKWEVTTSNAEGDIVVNDTKAEVALNVAFTYNGLRALGLSDAELVNFPKEFREGMEARAGLLGDIGPNHPSNWRLPECNWPVGGSGNKPGHAVHLSTVDLVIQLQTTQAYSDNDWLWSATHPLYKKVLKLAEEAEEGGAQLLSVQPLRRKRDAKQVHEHFGFRDGLSQPKPLVKEEEPDWIPVNELLIGNKHNDDLAAEKPESLLQNGTFLVVRKLSQNVDAFNKFLDSHNNVIDRDVLGAKMVGRDKAGIPIVDESISEPDKDNGFDYQNDPDGLRCPFHAHIRRTNPRTVRTGKDDKKKKSSPRIMRRGFSYGPRNNEGSDDRGIVFMAYNASIAQQFEVIQRWISGGNSTGVLSAQNDPLLGVAPEGQERTMRFIHNDKVMRINLGDEPFVKLEWGMYLFVPSIDALQELTQREVADKPYPRANTERGEGLINKFQLLHSAGQAAPTPDLRRENLLADRIRWKKLFEDRSTRRYAQDVWAAIRKRGGVLRTPYGVLVGKEELIMQVMRDKGEVFSVQEYFHRMRKSTGELHLGMDREPKNIERGPQPDQEKTAASAEDNNTDYVNALPTVEGETRYDWESKLTNGWIEKITSDIAFADAKRDSEQWLDDHLVRASEDNVEHGVIKLKEFVTDVVAQISAQRFGLPSINGPIQIGGVPGNKPHCPDDFRMAASYFFSPNPTGFVETQGRKRGNKLRETIAEYVENVSADSEPRKDTLLATLQTKYADSDEVARILAGAILGFVAPTTSSFLSVINTWIASEDLWRHQQSLLQQLSNEQDAYMRANTVLKPALIRAMQERPAPSLLHRTAVKKDELVGVAFEPGERIVLGLVSATLERLEVTEKTQKEKDKTRILFGGNYEEKDSQHACPGKNMAFGVLLGIISTLLERGGTLRHKGGLDLSVNEKDDLTVG